MEGNDLATWEERRLIIVLEGVLAQIPPPETTGRIRKRVTAQLPPDQWGWSSLGIKQTNDYAHRYSMPIEVVTFISPEVGDMGADWLNKYGVEVASCEYFDFDLFCESLRWRRDVERVVDTEPSRLNRYGQRGYQAMWGSSF